MVMEPVVVGVTNVQVEEMVVEMEVEEKDVMEMMEEVIQEVMEVEQGIELEMGVCGRDGGRGDGYNRGGEGYG